MNNNFDSEGKYEIYSKSYAPRGDEYQEFNNGYTKGGRPPKKSGSGKMLGAVIVVVICAIAFCFGLVALTAKLVSDFYDDVVFKEGEIIENEVEKLPEKDVLAEETPRKDDWFFGIDEDTEITISETVLPVTDGSIGDDDLSLTDVVALVKDSVVEITTSETLRNGLVYSSGAGSGVIINKSGIIVTNNHVIDGATNISVRLTSGSIYEGMLVASDEKTDLAVLKITPKEELCIAVCGDSDKNLVGEAVIAIGNPLGVLGGTVTNGIISALEREVTIEGEAMVLLQHNAAVSPGNSGGALFNMRGQLIGIVNAKFSSQGAEGLGFAIPINTAIEVYNDLVNFGYVKGRPDHGLTVVQQYTFSPGYYGYLLYVIESKYTDQFVYGDRIVSIDGVTPQTASEAYSLLEGYNIGDKIEIAVIRNGKQISVELEICEYRP